MHSPFSVTPGPPARATTPCLATSDPADPLPSSRGSGRSVVDDVGSGSQGGTERSIAASIAEYSADSGWSGPVGDEVAENLPGRPWSWQGWQCTAIVPSFCRPAFAFFWANVLLFAGIGSFCISQNRYFRICGNRRKTGEVEWKGLAWKKMILLRRKIQHVLQDVS